MKCHPKKFYSTRSKTSHWMTCLAGGLVLALTVCGGYAQTADVDLNVIFSDPACWSKTAAGFISEYKNLGFRMLDEDKTAMSNDAKHLRFLGHVAYEARVYFEANVMRRAEISVYNKVTYEFIKSHNPQLSTRYFSQLLHPVNLVAMI